MKKGDKETKKRSQKDYSVACKLMFVSDVEKGLLKYRQAQSKYGIQGGSIVLV